MSFQVALLQRPVDLPAGVVKVHMSTDELQRQLTKNMRNVISINDQPLTPAQKVILIRLGRRRGAVKIEGDGNNLFVTARLAGRLCMLTVDPTGDVQWAKLPDPARDRPTWRSM